MSSEIPEIFKALLEDPFTVPTFDYNGKKKQNNRSFFVNIVNKLRCVWMITNNVSPAL